VNRTKIGGGFGCDYSNKNRFTHHPLNNRTTLITPQFWGNYYPVFGGIRARIYCQTEIRPDSEALPCK
jgi:hypothetical protein